MIALTARPLDQVHAIWEDRLALWGRLTKIPAWATINPDVQDLIWEWAHEPVAAVDAIADQMRDSIHLLEGLRQ